MRERELGILASQIHGSSLAQVIICAAHLSRPGRRPEGRVGSHRALRGSRRGEEMGVSGASTERPLFLGLPFSACALARPQDSSGSDSFVHPFPLLPPLSFLLPPSNYSLVSSPAGRSFFEKTTRARTRPTHSHKKSRSLPHPNRRYSSTFVCIFPSPGSHTRSSSANAISFLLSSNSRPYPLHVPNLLPFPVISTYTCISLGFLPIPSELTSTCILHPILLSL